jgi:hypothetical protein
MNESPHLLDKVLSHYRALQRPPVLVTTRPMTLIGDAAPIAVPGGRDGYDTWRQRYKDHAPGAEPERPAMEHLAQGRVAWVIG